MSDVNITDAIFAVAQERPHAVAIIDGESVVSYHTLCAGVHRAAQRFHEAGWRAGDRIGISIRGRPALHLLVSLALARCGMTQVSWSAAEPPALIRSRIKVLDVTAMVSDHLSLESAGIAVLAPDMQWLTSPHDGLVADSYREPGGERFWIICESSGTTGRPKLIAITHRQEEEHGARVTPVLAYLPGERFLNLTALHFMSGMKRTLRCLKDGGTRVFLPGVVDTPQLLQWIERHDVTYLSGAPVHYHQMLRDISGNSPRLPRLRILRSTGSALPASILQAVRRCITPNVFVDYGLNEISVITVAPPDLLAKHAETAGLPLPGVELEVVDAVEQPLPPGVIGRVRTRGPGIHPSYLPALVEERERMFRNGWCYTGDVGFLNEEGLLFLKGRADDVMNFDGILIGPAEIESGLCAHPAVVEAAAFPLPSREHQDVPAAAVVCATSLQTEELARYCAERLGVRTPRFFLRVGTIPRNAMGKVLRNELIQHAITILQGRMEG